MMKKVGIGFLLGVVLGAGFGIFVLRALSPKVIVEGVVEYKPKNPGATAVPPEGFYVSSMIYLDGISQDSLGKKIRVKGELGSVADSDGYQNYPKLFKTFSLLD